MNQISDLTSSVLFETEKYTVIGADEMTNKESRDFLYNKENKDEILNVIDNGSHLLISNL